MLLHRTAGQDTGPVHIPLFLSDTSHTPLHPKTLALRTGYNKPASSKLRYSNFIEHLVCAVAVLYVTSTACMSTSRVLTTSL